MVRKNAASAEFSIFKLSSPFAFTFLLPLGRRVEVGKEGETKGRGERRMEGGGEGGREVQSKLGATGEKSLERYFHKHCSQHPSGRFDPHGHGIF